MGKTFNNPKTKTDRRLAKKQKMVVSGKSVFNLKKTIVNKKSPKG